jgi:hypothetical protein
MRKLPTTGAVDQDGNIVTIPRLPSVTGSNKPLGWNRWSAAEKAEDLLGSALPPCTSIFPGLPTALIHQVCSANASNSRRCDSRGQRRGRSCPRAKRALAELTGREFGARTGGLGRTCAIGQLAGWCGVHALKTGESGPRTGTNR